VYPRMIAEYAQVAKDLGQRFPGCEVINVSSVSRLTVFPRVEFEAFWHERWPR